MRDPSEMQLIVVALRARFLEVQNIHVCRATKHHLTTYTYTSKYISNMHLKIYTYTCSFANRRGCTLPGERVPSIRGSRR